MNNVEHVVELFKGCLQCGTLFRQIAAAQSHPTTTAALQMLVWRHRLCNRPGDSQFAHLRQVITAFRQEAIRNGTALVALHIPIVWLWRAGFSCRLSTKRAGILDGIELFPTNATSDVRAENRVEAMRNWCSPCQRWTPYCHKHRAE